MFKCTYRILFLLEGFSDKISIMLAAIKGHIPMISLKIICFHENACYAYIVF